MPDIKRYYPFLLVLVLAAILWFISGFWGLIVGVSASIFVFFIIKRKKEDDAFRSAAENAFSSLVTSQSVKEVFPGALYVVSLAVFCYHDVDLASSQLRTCFSPQYNADWATLCRAAAQAESLNGDLLVECLAATLRKSGQAQNNSTLINTIFKLLSAAELGWKTEDRGNPPSHYLAELLQYKYITDEVASACIVLGVTPKARVAEIKKAYRSLAQIYHPDTVRNLSSEQQQTATEAFLRIKKAYEVLESYALRR